MMRRIVFLLAVAALALLMEAGLARAQAAVGDSVAAAATAEDPLLATGQVGCCQYRFTIDAQSGPSGESPGGSVAVQFLGRDLLPYSFSGHVSCLAVSGKLAAIGVIVDQSEGLPAPAVGQAVTLFAADHHAPVTGTLFGGAPPDADRLEVDLTSSGCPAFPPASNALYYVYNGDIAIHDAIPVPTAKDQCKNGGWRTYGVFKNQGDCVSFVATGGKNPPGRKTG
jgi:hypothetical protein